MGPPESDSIVYHFQFVKQDEPDKGKVRTLDLRTSHTLIEGAEKERDVATRIHLWLNGDELNGRHTFFPR